MTVQALWDRDSPLKQIPHVTNTIVEALQSEGVETVFDLIEMEDDGKRTHLLGLDSAKMGDVARFVNAYPNIDVSLHLVNGNQVEAGETVTVQIQLDRDQDDDETTTTSVGPVSAPYYPLKKDEGWWLIVSDPHSKSLLAIKRVSFSTRKTTVKLDFSAPEDDRIGSVKCQVLVMSDSYLGVDQEFDLELVVRAAPVVAEEEEDTMEQD